MVDRRYDFWGHKKRKPIKQTKEEEKEEKTKREFPTGIFLVIGLIVASFVLLLVIFPIINTINDPTNTIIDGTYTITVYVPDCDNGKRVYTENKVSGQFLYDNGYAEKEMFSDTLTPVGNFQKWDNYVRNKTGERIPGDKCCINFVKE